MLISLSFGVILTVSIMGLDVEVDPPLQFVITYGSFHYSRL